MRARAVLGASFGDEGKGLLVDYLAANESAGMICRANGGSQSGHTVVTDAHRHAFSHIGAGTFLGIPTYLTSFFILNPIQYFKEWFQLRDLGVDVPQVYAHPECLVTTYADMLINQMLEDARGSKRHGSCGLGINETIERSNIPHLKITMSDLWNGVDLQPKLAEICDKYACFRTGKHIDQPDMAAGFPKVAERFAEAIRPLGMGQVKDPIFEGAQGLLLDQNRIQDMPHLTRSNTGAQNVRTLCAQAGVTDIDLYYVSRTYLTRHGAGPLPGEDPKLHYADDTNVDHPYQGKLRFAPLDYDALRKRCAEDAKGPYRLVLTHADQERPKGPADLLSYGPTRNDVRAPLLAAANA